MKSDNKNETKHEAEKDAEVSETVVGNNEDEGANGDDEQGEYLSIDLSIYLSIYLFIYLSIYLCIYLSIYLSIYLDAEDRKTVGNNEVEDTNVDDDKQEDIDETATEILDNSAATSKLNGHVAIRDSIDVTTTVSG